MSPFLVLVLLALIVYKLYKHYHDYPENTPPGLPRLPMLGSYPFLLWGNYNFPHKTIDYYTKKLNSKLISCYFGPFLAVIANDYKTVKAMLTKDEFDGRLTDVHVIRARAFGKKLGIFFVEGEQWQEQRRFALRHMRDFGFGRRQEKYESEIAEELATLVDFMKNGPINSEERKMHQNGKVLFPDALYAYATNSIWQVMFGERFDRSEHDKLRALCASALVFQRAADTSGGAIIQFEFLKYLGNMFGYTKIIEGNDGVVNFIKHYLEMHKKTHEADSDRGMIDRYLDTLKTSDESTYFSEEQLIMTLVDFMFPALSAMPTMITHGLKFIMHNPEVMRKMQEEIDTVVGCGRLVTWEDRKNLPYTEATVREFLRCETLTPFGVIHKCMEDTTFLGYNIPKNTAIMTNLAAMNNDPELWGDPENFRPERFLEDQKDPSFPFGFGHRVCAGETFARYNLFGLFAVLVQNFQFSFVEGEPNSLEDKVPGLIVTPKELWLRVEARS